MIRKTLYSFILSAFATDLVASQHDDAGYLFDEFFTEAHIEQIRDNSAKIYVLNLSKKLGEFSIRVIEKERFEEMVPNSVTDIAISGLRSDTIDHILEDFSASELSGIVEFLNSDVWQKLKEAPSADNVVVIPGFAGYDENSTKSILSEEKFQQFQAFFESEPGKAFEEEIRGFLISLGFGVGLAPLRMNNIEPEIYAPFVIEVLEADRIVAFSNPVARKDLIAQFKAEMLKTQSHAN